LHGFLRLVIEKKQKTEQIRVIRALFISLFHFYFLSLHPNSLKY